MADGLTSATSNGRLALEAPNAVLRIRTAACRRRIPLTQNVIWNAQHTLLWAYNLAVPLRLLVLLLPLVLTIQCTFAVGGDSGPAAVVTSAPPVVRPAGHTYVALGASDTVGVG